MTVCCIPAGGAHDVLVSLITGLSWVLVLAGRFVAGRPLDGRVRTNCTYLRRGTAALEGAPVPGWWVYQPLSAWWSAAAGCQRQAIRLTATTGTGLLVYGWVVCPALTVLALASTTAAGVVWAARRREDRRRHDALAVTARTEPSAEAEPAEVYLIAVRRAARPARVTATVLPGRHEDPARQSPRPPVLAAVPDGAGWDAWQCGGLGGSFTGLPAAEAMARAARAGQGRS